MTAPRCDQLDEYLCGWLSPDEAAAYEAHWADCAACREECALQRRLDRLIAEGNDSIASAPAALKDRVESRIRAARRRHMLVWVGAITAATGVAIALGLWVTRDVRSSPREQRQAAQSLEADDHGLSSIARPADVVPPAVVAQVTMVDPSSAIVVPVDSKHPNVTVVCIFPTNTVPPIPQE